MVFYISIAKVNCIIYRSGLDAYPLNAKIRYNWGTELQENEKWSEAAAEYLEAIELTGDRYYLAICNLGFVYEKLKKPWVNKMLTY